MCDYCGSELRNRLQVCCGEIHNHEYGSTDDEKQEIEQARLDQKEQTDKDNKFHQGEA